MDSTKLRFFAPCPRGLEGVLEQEIHDALAHPSIDGLKIAELKRRKLQVKDEIARLRQDASVH